MGANSDESLAEVYPEIHNPIYNTRSIYQQPKLHMVGKQQDESFEFTKHDPSW